MDERERRRAYRHNAVLIDSDRVLTPQFDDAIVYLTGAQLELLRNVSQYLNRRETYRAEKHPGYYLMPDDSDYDDILAIVADMEESLMGNPNTIWGYKDTYSQKEEEPYTTTGFKRVHADAVPAGELYVVTGISAQFISGTVTAMYLYLTMAAGEVMIKTDLAPVQGYPLSVTGMFPLKEGQHVTCAFNVTVQPCTVRIYVSGYMMAVPE